MKIISKLKMDLLRQEPPQLIPAVREDSHARALEIALLHGGRAWPLPHGVRAVVRYAKADGTGGAYDTLPDGTDAWRAEGNLLTIVLGLGVPGVWLGMVIEWCIRAVALRMRVRGDKWLSHHQ